MAPLEKARRHFGGGGGNKKKGRGNDCARKGGGFQIAKRATEGARGTKPTLLTSV
jgi:hypothetical protein